MTSWDEEADGVEPPVDPERPVLPGYRVGAYLGGGGSGLVWAVTRESDGARLAAKVLVAAADDVVQEMMLLQRIDHEHVLRLHDVLREESGSYARPVLVTDLAEGGSLAEAIRGRGHLTVGELVTVLCPVARAVHDLHGLGLVHGDLSAGNVLLTGAGKPLIGDLGVARLAGVVQPEVWGTAGYVAPEVLSGEQPGPAADVYALGALAWTALVGAAPDPPALRPDLEDVAPGAPQRVRDLVLCCLSHTPEARPTAGELALRLWDSAGAEPAPVPGSVGRRTAAGPVDPAAGLTQRIRERSSPEHAATALPWHRHPVVRRTAVTAAAIGIVSGAYAVASPGPVRAVAGPVTLTGVPAGGEGTAAAHPATSPTAGAPRASAPRTDPVSTPRSSPTSAPPTTPAPAVAGPEALGSDTVGVLQSLVDARARAWSSGSEDELAGALVAGSTAWQRDRGDLGTAANQHVRYQGLSFRVRSATLDPAAGSRTQVAAVVDRSAYVVVRDGRRSAVPASAGEHTVLSLAWTDAGWRIADWGAPS